MAGFVHKHLETISRKGLDRYSKVVLDYIRGGHGVYVLHADNRPYFVGAAARLQDMLENHLKDWKWDTFSVYMLSGAADIKDMETLLLKVALPAGNRQPGGFQGSEDLKPDFRRRVSEMQKKELAAMVGDAGAGAPSAPAEKPQKPSRRRRGKAKKTGPMPAPPPQQPVVVKKEEPQKDARKEEPKKEEPQKDEAKKPSKRRSRGRKNVLSPYAKRSFEIRFWYQGRQVRGTVEKDGSITCGGKSYSSPSLAASDITGRSTNGWQVWKFERSSGEWVVLDELRRPAAKAS